MAEPALKLSGGEPRGFDHRAWEWAVRDSGLLREFKPADSKLYILGKSLADKLGEFDLCVSWTAEQLGFTRKGVQGALERMQSIYRLFEHAGYSKVNRRVLRYRLIYPPAIAPTIAAVKGTDGPRSQQVEPGVAPPGVPLSENRGSHERERGFSQSEIKAKEKAAQGVPPPQDRSPLFEPKPYDADAAAVLVAIGFDKRRAHGLITQYRPTAAELQNVADNISAKNAEAGDNRKRQVRNVQAFVMDAIKNSNYALDDRVLDQRRDQRKANERRQREADEQRQRAAAGRAYWESLTDQQRQEATDEAIRRLGAGYRDDAERIHTEALNLAKRNRWGNWRGEQ